MLSVLSRMLLRWLSASDGGPRGCVRRELSLRQFRDEFLQRVEV
jgi:hypothetical protein